MDNFDNNKRSKKSDKMKKTRDKYGNNTTKGGRIKQASIESKNLVIFSK